MRELVDDRGPDFIGELVRVGEVRLKRQSEEDDPVREGGPVGAPLGAWHPLVETVERVVVIDPVLQPLVRRRLVVDDDGNLVERARERLGDRGEGELDQRLEGSMAAGSRSGAGAAGAAAALDHGDRILRAMTTDTPSDRAAEPAGFVVEVAPGDRIHFLDWGSEGRPGVLLIHGLSNTAWSWTPVARRLRSRRRVVAMDLRGHGLSDAPTDGYDAQGFTNDVVAAAEGSGLLAVHRDRVVLAGHGFGAIVASWAAVELGDRCAGLVLVDGGWESIEAASGMEVDEFLRNLDEPPEVMRSLPAFLADRAGFDPASWDADQERAARATVVETHAGKVVPATRPHALEGSVRAMFAYEPGTTLAGVAAPVVALLAGGDEDGSRTPALAEASAARAAAGRDAIAVSFFEHAGHNLMRYRPDSVSAAILSIAGPAGGPKP